MIEEFRTEEQWIAARRKYVTSTEVSALFGQNPRLTAFELACIKRDPTLDPFEPTERTQAGQALQDAIALKMVAPRCGAHLVPLERQLANFSPYLAASGDYLIANASAGAGDDRLSDYFSRHGHGMLEVKNVDSLIYKNEWTETDMPDHIEIQLQAELLCWNVEWGCVSALVGGNRLELYIRERDAQVCEMIATRSKEFMENLAKGVLPPPVMPEDAGMVIALHQYAEPNKVYDAKEDDYLLNLCREYKEHSAIIDRSNKARDSIKATILSRIGDAERVINMESFNLSASLRAPVEIAAYTRAAFRGLNITVKRKPK